MLDLRFDIGDDAASIVVSCEVEVND